MNYGFDEQPTRAGLIAGAILGALAGVIGGLFAFLAATAFFVMIGDAVPSLSGIAATVLYFAFLLVPTLAFASILRRKEARFGPRVMSLIGMCVLMILGIGEVTSTFVIYPRNLHFYITPGPYYGDGANPRTASNLNDCKEDATGYETQSRRLRESQKLLAASRQLESAARMLEKCAALAPTSRQKHELLLFAALGLVDAAGLAHGAGDRTGAIRLLQEGSGKLRVRLGSFADVDENVRWVAKSRLDETTDMARGKWPLP
jgi:hypothetical protein